MKKAFKVLLCILAIGLLMPVMAAPVTTGGDIPVVNTCYGTGITGLDFTGPGAAVQIANFTINCNHEKGFDLNIAFDNSAKFVTASSASEIAFSALLLDVVPGGTLGAGLAAPVNIDILADAQTGDYDWNPGAAQTTATVDYVIELKASWADPAAAGKLAGIYTEVVTTTITVGL